MVITTRILCTYLRTPYYYIITVITILEIFFSIHKREIHKRALDSNSHTQTRTLLDIIVFTLYTAFSITNKL